LKSNKCVEVKMEVVLRDGAKDFVMNMQKDHSVANILVAISLIIQDRMEHGEVFDTDGDTIVLNEITDDLEKDILGKLKSIEDNTELIIYSYDFD